MNRFALLILAILFCTMGRAPAAPKRPPVGVPADAVHFNGKWYRVYLEKATWRQARDRCRTHGGQLAVIHDEPTHVFVQELVKGRGDFWIGASDEETEGRWVWLDGKEMTYQKWGGRNPNGRRSENFLGLGWKGTGFFDAPDSWPCIGYICEWVK